MGSIRDLHTSPGVYTKIRDRKQAISRGSNQNRKSASQGGGGGPQPQGAWVFDNAFPIVFS